MSLFVVPEAIGEAAHDTSPASELTDALQSPEEGGASGSSEAVLF